LKSIHSIIQNFQEEGNCVLLTRILYDKLLAHFLSTHRFKHFSDNINCLLTLVTDEKCQISQSVLAFYLKRALKLHCSHFGIGFNSEVMFGQPRSDPKSSYCNACFLLGSQGNWIYY
jgi:hypothetical protein